MLRRSSASLCAAATALCPFVLHSCSPTTGVHQITLAREKALNALDISMVDSLTQLYASIHSKPEVTAAVVLKGAGAKAFCAGGDVVSITQDKPPGTSRRFFYSEYQADYAIMTLAKHNIAHVALWDGIVMGGGFGVSGHGSHRLTSEKAVFAMPETGIGLFPDVGGSYFLPRLPIPGMGMFLALTGQRLKGEDVVHAGLGTDFVPTGKMGEIEAAIVGCTDLLKATDRAALVTAIVKGVVGTRTPAPFSLAPHLDTIADVFGSSAESVEGVIEALKSKSAAPDDWAAKTATHMATLSPSALKVCFALQRAGAAITDPKEIFSLEYRATQRMMETNDFRAGVTALLIEKTKKVTWSPATLAEVTPDLVAKHFQKPSHGIEWDPVAQIPL